MAIRMQQRRGTAEQWGTANPILGAGEIGFETDTGQFKIGDGINHWEDLSYFKNLDDLGANLDDYILVTQKGSVNGVATLDGTGKIPVSQLPDQDALDAEVDAAIVAHSADTDPHGDRAYTDAREIAITSAYESYANQAELDAISTAAADATSKANAAKSGAEATAAAALASAVSDLEDYADQAEADAIATAAADATTKANNAKSDAIATAAADATTKATNAENAAKAYTDAREIAITNAYESYADQSEVDAKTYTDGQIVTALNTASGDASTKANTAEENAKDYTDAEILTEVSNRNAAIATAKTEAIDAAAADATSKANAAKLAAEQDANAYTDAREVIIRSFATQQASDYAVNAIAQLVDSSPEALNTLNELAAALGDDPNFATTVTNNLASKAPLASPSLTGTPTAPTAASGTNTTQIATTAFVTDALEDPLSDISQAQTDITTLQTDLSAVESDVSLLQTNLGLVTSDVSTLQTGLSNAQGDITSLDGRLDTAESDIDAAQADLISLDGRLDSAESSIVSINTTNTSQGNSINFLTGKVNTYGLDILALNEDVTALEGRLDVAEPEIDTLQSTQSSHGTRLTAAESDIDGVQADVVSLDTRMNTAESDINAAESNITSLDGRLDVAESSLVSLDGRLDIAESSLVSLDGRLDTAESNITSLDGRLDTAESDINTLELGLSSAQSDLNTAESNISTLQADLNTAESNISTLQGDLDTAEITLATVVSDLDNHEASTTSVHGIANTADLATKSYADTAATNAQSAATNYVDAELADYATKASPTFTGTVVLPSTTSIGNVTNTEIGYLDGVTSGIQTQINAKAPSASPTFSGTVVLPATTSIGTVDATELSHLEGVTDNIQGQLSTKAPLSSPAFIGTPTAPTADAGTDTTQIATTAFVQDAIEAVVGAAPAALNTLSELADALNDDANFASTITTSIATKLNSSDFTYATITIPVYSTVGDLPAAGGVNHGRWAHVHGEGAMYYAHAGSWVKVASMDDNNLKANTASPTFTGTVVLPSTTSIGDVSSTEIGFLDGVTSSIQTQLNTKAPSASPTFTGTVALPATSSVTLGGTALSVTLDEKANKTAGISSKTGAYTFANGDVNMIFEYNSASAGTFTIPADNSFWPVGQRLEVLQVAGGQLTIAGGSGVTVNGTPTTKTRTTWSGATIIKRAANTFVVVGDLASS